MRCQACGTENADHAAFCKECGAKLSFDMPEEADVSVQEKNGRAKIWVIGLCVVVFLGLVAGGVYIVRDRADQPASARQDATMNEVGESKSVSEAEEEKKSVNEARADAEAAREEQEPKEAEEKEQEPKEAEEKEQEPKETEQNEQEPEEADEERQESRRQEAQAPVITMQNVTGAAASSELAEAHTVHSAMRAMDGDKNTAWVEGASGQGEGQFIQFSFNDSYLVSGVRIRAGYQKNDDIYYKNSRPREVEIRFSDESSETFELDDRSQEEQVLTLAKPVETNSVRLIIKSVYPGGKYEDTCISEMAFF